ncbi:mannose-1-phosphate guanylyltransferase [Flavobacterium sp. TSSA_36]|uniref:mannose-1-phosphate guanylyltransferase n=1 Tax=Flavobacterium sp. TSSA_36 TaxID=3447669 RepID=UPI003F31F698
MSCTNTITHVILTGGVGSRLWPLSRKSQPKQYLELFEGKSLFEMTVARNRALADAVVVVGNTDNCELSRKILEKTSTSYTDIIEATARNTAAAIAFAAFAAAPDTILVVTPSDHIIAEGKAYQDALSQAIATATAGYLVTFGIVPTHAETGYGYIEHREGNVLSFREKPDQETAKAFLAQGDFLWNSGLFCFKAGVFLDELQQHAPEVYRTSKIAWEQAVDGRLDLALSMAIPSISVDYAVMERSKKIKVVSSHFEWSDLGSFEAVYAYLKAHGHPVDSQGNMVIGTSTHTSFLGLQDTIFVHTATANLILQKAASQEVKQLYAQLEEGQSDLLN